MRIFLGLITILLLSNCGGTPSKVENEDSMQDIQQLLIGTYTKKEGHVDGKAEGVYIYDFNLENGSIEQKGVIPGLINPSFLTISSDGKSVYVVNETGPDVDTTASITAFSRNIETGELSKLNEQPTFSFAPCHVSIDHSGQYVMVANYIGGIIAIYPRKDDGSLGVATDIVRLEGSGSHAEQESSHPHCILSSPDNKYIYVPDKGTDKVMAFQLQDGQLIAAQPAFANVQTGAGPRHISFHPREAYAYLINELDASINAFQYYAATGRLEEIQRISTLPSDYSGFNACADIHLTPNGKFLYGSNRGHNSIAIYRVDQQSGKLTLMGHESTRGDFPRNFMIDNSGRWLLVANQNSDNIAIFEIDQETGLLNFEQEIDCKTPVCIQQIP